MELHFSTNAGYFLFSKKEKPGDRDKVYNNLIQFLILFLSLFKLFLLLMASVQLET